MSKTIAQDTAIAQVPASMGLTGIDADGNGITLHIGAGTTMGKLSSTGKSMVLVSDKVKFTRADGQEVVAQVTCYVPVSK